MENYTPFIIFIVSFRIVALASKQIGAFFSRYNLPLISGFLFAGVLVGPFVLDMIPTRQFPNSVLWMRSRLASSPLLRGASCTLKIYVTG